MPDNENLHERIVSLQELNEELGRLDEKLKGKSIFNIFNPTIRKKRDLILELQNRITKLELAEIKIPSENNEDKDLRKRIIDNIKEIVSLIPELQKNTEPQFKAKKAIFDELINKFNKGREEEIDTLNYGRDIFSMMDILTTVTRGVLTIILGWNIGIAQAAAYTGIIFYPINAAFIATAMLFNLIIRVIELFRASGDLQAAKEKALGTQEQKDAEFLLKTSAAFRFLIFTVQVLSVLAFAGLLSTPLGWIFVAGATLITWIDETFSKIKTAKADLRAFEISCCELSFPEYKKNYIKLQEEVAKAEKDAAWNFINVISAILIACGPIPVAGPFLGLIGLGLLAINPVRKGLTAIHNKFFKEKKSDPASTTEYQNDFEPAANDATCSTDVTVMATLKGSQEYTEMTSREELLNQKSETPSFLKRFFSFWPTLQPKTKSSESNLEPEGMQKKDPRRRNDKKGR
jgi:hypothetical protein